MVPRLRERERAEPIVYTKTLTAPRSQPSKRLPGVPQTRTGDADTHVTGPTTGRTVQDLELWGENLALTVSYGCGGCAGIDQSELRLDDLGDGSAEQVAFQLVGLSGQTLVGPSFFNGPARLVQGLPRRSQRLPAGPGRTVPLRADREHIPARALGHGARRRLHRHRRAAVRGARVLGGDVGSGERELPHRHAAPRRYQADPRAAPIASRAQAIGEEGRWARGQGGADHRRRERDRACRPPGSSSPRARACTSSGSTGRLKAAVEELGRRARSARWPTSPTRRRSPARSRRGSSATGGYDVLFSNAGISGEKPDRRLPLRRVRADARGAHPRRIPRHQARRAARARRRQHRHHVERRGLIGRRPSAYVAAKHGQVGLMRTAAKELAARRIRVNTLHPGRRRPRSRTTSRCARPANRRRQRRGSSTA